MFPNCPLCLIRTSGRASRDLFAIVETLNGHGLKFNHDGPELDIVIADQKLGFTSAGDWTEFGHIGL